MTEFTYDITDTSDISSLMRRELGDTRLNDGILPEGRNFSDDELDYFYDQEDDDFWNAVARAFDAAAAEWARYPEAFHMGPEYQKIPSSSYFANRAQKIRTSRQRPGVYAVEKSEYAMDVD